MGIRVQFIMGMGPEVTEAITGMRVRCYTAGNMATAPMGLLVHPTEAVFITILITHTFGAQVPEQRLAVPVVKGAERDRVLLDAI